MSMKSVWEQGANIPAKLGKQIIELENQIVESKQREARLTQERDAALSAWQLLHDYTKGEVKDWEGRNADRFWQSNRFLQTMENWLATSTAALAERDRVIERKTAERCIDLVGGQANADVIRREFNLDHKA